MTSHQSPPKSHIITTTHVLLLEGEEYRIVPLQGRGGVLSQLPDRLEDQCTFSRHHLDSLVEKHYYVSERSSADISLYLLTQKGTFYRFLAFWEKDKYNCVVRKILSKDEYCGFHYLRQCLVFYLDDRISLLGDLAIIKAGQELYFERKILDDYLHESFVGHRVQGVTTSRHSSSSRSTEGLVRSAKHSRLTKSHRACPHVRTSLISTDIVSYYEMSQVSFDKIVFWDREPHPGSGNPRIHVLYQVADGEICLLSLGDTPFRVSHKKIFPTSRDYLYCADDDNGLWEFYRDNPPVFFRKKNEWVGEQSKVRDTTLGVCRNIQVIHDYDDGKANEDIIDLTDYAALQQRGLAILPQELASNLIVNRSRCWIYRSSSGPYMVIVWDDSIDDGSHRVVSFPSRDGMPVIHVFFISPIRRRPGCPQYTSTCHGIACISPGRDRLVHYSFKNPNGLLDMKEHSLPECFRFAAMNRTGVVMTRGSESMIIVEYETGDARPIYRRETYINYEQITYRSSPESSHQWSNPSRFILRVRASDYQQTVTDPLTWYLIAYLQANGIKLYVQILDDTFPRFPSIDIENNSVKICSYATAPSFSPTGDNFNRLLFERYFQQTYRPFRRVPFPEDVHFSDFYMGDHGEGTTRDFLREVTTHLANLITEPHGTGRQFRNSSPLLKPTLFPDTHNILDVTGRVFSYAIRIINGPLPCRLPASVGIVLGSLREESVPCDFLEIDECNPHLFENLFRTTFPKITPKMVQELGETEDPPLSPYKIHTDYMFAPLISGPWSTGVYSLLDPLVADLPDEAGDARTINYWLCGSSIYLDRKLFFDHLSIGLVENDKHVALDPSVVRAITLSLAQMSDDRFISILVKWSAYTHPVPKTYQLRFREGSTGSIHTCFNHIELPTSIASDPELIWDAILRA